MNNSQIFPNIGRFFLVALVQLLLFKQIAIMLGVYYNILVWPIFILLLPIQMGTPLIVLLGFLSGLAIDLLYGSPGLHASAGTFAGFVRPFVLRAFEPKGGFSGKEPIAAPAYFGWSWYIQVTAVFSLLFLFWFFSIDAFTFFYFGTIALKTLSSWALSMIFIVIFTFLVNPKN
ncbi:MAG: hypothetical protein IPL65_18875 [Lewinellaceae bacterium]|nr:hypothetical protein [Lewinellaceae bacterium]